MKAIPHPTPPSRSVSWTKERIDALVTADVRQLRVNAERLNDPEIMKLCDAVLSARRKRTPQPGAKAANPTAGGAA